MPEGWRAPEQHHHTIDVNVNIVGGTGSSTDLSALVAKLNQLIALATTQGATMSALSDAVTGFISDATSDYAALNDKYLAALAAEAVDQATIDQITAEQAATIAEQQASVDALNAADLDPTNPVVEPPVEPPA